MFPVVTVIKLSILTLPFVSVYTYAVIQACHLWPPQMRTIILLRSNHFDIGPRYNDAKRYQRTDKIPAELKFQNIN